MVVCATPETVFVKLLGFGLLVLPFSALLASLGLGKGVNIHGCRSRSVYICLQKLLDRHSLLLQGVNARSLYSQMISEDLRTDLLDAHHVYRFPEVLHIIAKSLAIHSRLLLESLHACNHVSIANVRRREQPPQQLHVSQRVARIIPVIQSSPCIEPHFSLGETLSALFHEGNQVTVKLHVEICNVIPILPRSNLSDSEIG